MAGKYMPPHRRNQNAPSSSSANPTLERKPEDGYTITELANQFDCKHKVGTLNSCSVLGKNWDNSSLAFIVLFRDQHPQWPPKIFCKTNLNLLPVSPCAKDGGLDSEGVEINGSLVGQEATSGPLSGPIPIFIELFTKYVQGPRPEKRYIFTHYYHITSVDYFAPQSQELVAMLDTKFTSKMKNRSAEAWRASLSLKWAVVSLEKWVGEGEEKANPMEPLKELNVQSVSERLAELRMEKENMKLTEGKRAGWGKDGKDEANVVLSKLDE